MHIYLYVGRLSGPEAAPGAQTIFFLHNPQKNDIIKKDINSEVAIFILLIPFIVCFSYSRRYSSVNSSTAAVLSGHENNLSIYPEEALTRWVMTYTLQ